MATMVVLVTYDVSTETKAGRRRLRRIAKACENVGQRVQFSVFECNIDGALWAKLRGTLLDLFEPREDSLRFYFLGADDVARAEHHGTKPKVDFDGPLIL
jgi:CRISPR-associated protein Cas2